MRHGPCQWTRCSGTQIEIAPLCISLRAFRSLAASPIWEPLRLNAFFRTWSTVSRDSRSPEINLMRIMGVHRSLERDKQRERAQDLPEHMGNAFQTRTSVQVRKSALPAEFPFTSGESLTSWFLVTLQFSLVRRMCIALTSFCINTHDNHYYLRLKYGCCTFFCGKLILPPIIIYCP